MKTVAIIQARMGSSRFPGKILMEIAGKPMIYHIVERARDIKNVDEVVLATTRNREDNRLVNWAKKARVKIFRGDENDVLARFYEAAKQFRADIIVRVCADSPLFDPNSVSDMIVALRNDADYVTANQKQLATSGIDVFSFRALEKAFANAASLYEREHVTPYILNNPSQFSFAKFRVKKIFNKDNFRLTVDVASDLELIQEIYKKLWKVGKIVSLPDVLRLLRKDSSLAAKNAHVIQRGGAYPGFNILILVAAKGKIGYGHLFRMVRLAKTLTENFANGVKFLIAGDNFAKEHLKSNGFGVINFDEKTTSKIKELKPQAIIIDSHEEKLRKFFKKIDGGPLKVSYDDDINSKNADLVFTPLGKSRENNYVGLKYLILSKKINVNGEKKRKYLLISAGAADPGNYTLRIAQKIIGRRIKYPAALLIGPAYKHITELNNFKREYPMIKIFQNSDLGEAFSQTKIAICHFGVTMFEMIASNIVCAVYAINEDHMEQIRKFSKIGFVYNLGYFKDRQIVNKINAFLKENKLVKEIFSNIRGKIDSKGALRVAQVTQSRLLEKLI